MKQELQWAETMPDSTRAFYILIHFLYRLQLNKTWTDQFLGFVESVAKCK